MRNVKVGNTVINLEHVTKFVYTPSVGLMNSVLRMLPASAFGEDENQDLFNADSESVLHGEQADALWACICDPLNDVVTLYRRGAYALPEEL